MTSSGTSVPFGETPAARSCRCGAPVPDPIQPTGTYRNGAKIVGVGFQCPSCGSDSLILARDVSPILLRKARAVDAMRVVRRMG